MTVEAHTHPRPLRLLRDKEGVDLDGDGDADLTGADMLCAAFEDPDTHNVTIERFLATMKVRPCGA